MISQATSVMEDMPADWHAKCLQHPARYSLHSTPSLLQQWQGPLCAPKAHLHRNPCTTRSLIGIPDTEVNAVVTAIAHMYNM
jgi:hypothetical protein